MRFNQAFIGRLKKLIKKILTIATYYFAHERVRAAIEKVSSSPKIDTVHIEATNICNAACVFCAYPDMERPQKVMDMITFMKIVDKSLKAGVRRFDLTPVVGDPFADQHFFERLEYLVKMGATKVGFTTNAIAFSPTKIDKLFEFRKENPNLRIGFTISLGGFDRETYLEIFKVDKFKAVSNNILYLLKASEGKGSPFGKINVLARCPPERFSGDFYETLSFFKEKDICNLNLGDNEYGNWGGKVDTQELKKLGFRIAKVPKRFYGPCNLMFHHGVVVSTEGKVNACACRDVELTLPIGDIGGERSLEDVLCGQERQTLIQDFMDGRIPEYCRSCSDYHSVFDPTSKFFKKYVAKVYGDPY